MADEEKLLPLTDEDILKIPPINFRISMAKLLAIGTLDPIVLIVYTIIKTIMNDYAGSTYTECHVLEILPSLSQVIHDQQSAWLQNLWIHLPVRLLLTQLYWRYYKQRLPQSAKLLGFLTIGFLIFSSLCSIPLAYLGHIKSSETIHKITVLSVMFFDLGFVLTAFLSFKRCRREPMEPIEIRSYRLKRKILYTCFGSQLVLWIAYTLHVYRCVPLAYSVFSLCEYIFTISVLCFLCTSWLDFHTLYLCYDEKLGVFLADI